MRLFWEGTHLVACSHLRHCSVLVESPLARHARALAHFIVEVTSSRSSMILSRDDKYSAGFPSNIRLRVPTICSILAEHVRHFLSDRGSAETRALLRAA